jgi:hypothetical protein
MVLYPLADCPPAERTSTTDADAPIPAWAAVEQKQKATSKEWLLINQVDHAELAGDLAARLQGDIFPPLDPELIRAIALHDAGWAEFDAGRTTAHSPPAFPRLNDRGKPLSFLEATPAQFVVAWAGSIQKAQETEPAGGIIVSRHFCRLAESRLNSRIDDEEDTSRLRQFLHSEGERQRKLITHARHADDLDVLTDVLQFCDLLSLYLCCGATQGVNFPQLFKGESISLWREADVFHFEPAIFGSGVSLGICARLYTPRGAGPSRTLAFLLD